MRRVLKYLSGSYLGHWLSVAFRRQQRFWIVDMALKTQIKTNRSTELYLT